MTTATITLYGIELEVEFTYHKGCRGLRDKYGAPLEPDEEASIELASVGLANNAEVDLCSLLSTDAFEKIEEEIFRWMKDQRAESYDEDRR